MYLMYISQTDAYFSSYFQLKDTQTHSLRRLDWNSTFYSYRSLQQCLFLIFTNVQNINHGISLAGKNSHSWIGVYAKADPLFTLNPQHS